MPSRLDTTVLSLDIDNIKKMDTNTENLFSMWTKSLEHGRRLENLSWRLWTKETICSSTDGDEHEDSLPSAINIPSKQQESTEDVPDLSASVDSISSECERRSSFSRRNSSDKMKGKDKHITSSHLAQLMINFNHDTIQDAEHEFHVRRSSTPPVPTKTIEVDAHPSPASSEEQSSPESTSSDESIAASHTSSHSVVRGFTPGVVSNSYRSSAKLPSSQPASEPEMVPPPAIANSKKKSKMFTIGSSVSDDSGSLSDRYGSALTKGLKRTESSGANKRAAFDDHVTTRTVYADEYDSDDSDDDNVSESAIEDDDASDWESDSLEDSCQSSYANDNMFARVEEPRPALTSRRSLLSTLLHEPERAAVLAKAGTRSLPAMRSRASSPMGPSMPPSPSQDSPIATDSRAQPLPIIMTTSNIHPPALSPRTTRRNMLSTELTESLRKHMLWERQQRNIAANAVLKRRHTTQNLANMGNEDPIAARNNSYNHYFDQGLQEYFYTGW